MQGPHGLVVHGLDALAVHRGGGLRGGDGVHHGAPHGHGQSTTHPMRSITTPELGFYQSCSSSGSVATGGRPTRALQLQSLRRSAIGFDRLSQTLRGVLSTLGGGIQPGLCDPPQQRVASERAVEESANPVGDCLDFANSSTRTAWPHGGAPYVQIGKRNQMDGH